MSDAERQKLMAALAFGGFFVVLVPMMALAFRRCDKCGWAKKQSSGTLTHKYFKSGTLTWARA